MSEITPLHDRKWYQKKRYLIPTIFLSGTWLVSSLSSPDTTSTQSYTSPSTYIENIDPISDSSSTETTKNIDTLFEEPIQETPIFVPSPIVTDEVPLSNDNTYINSRDNEVHSPAYAPSVPEGASAICGDGTYSFSQSRRGTCSHHGGIVEWL